MFDNKYPYTDYHEMNLDWFLAKFKELVATWEQVQSDWNSLRDFVQNYFDNLDVQTEINNKINAMIADGSFAAIITPLVEAALPAVVAGQLPDVVATQISAVVAAQIDAVVAGQLPAIAAQAAADEVGTWLAAHIDPDTGYVIDDTLTVSNAAADAKTVGDDISILKDIVGARGKYIQTGHPTPSQYYKWIEELDTTKTYILKIISSTSGSMTLTFGTSASGEGIVDTVVSSYSFTANTPAYIEYTPSQSGLLFTRLWIATSWTIEIYEKIGLWPNDLNLENKIDDNRSIINGGFNYSKALNQLDKNNFLTNLTFDSSGRLTASTSYSTTNEIYLSAGDVLDFTMLYNDDRRLFSMYLFIAFDSDGAMIDYDNDGITTYTATVDCVVRFAIANTNIAAWETKKPFAGINTSSDISYYDEYGYNVSAKSVDKVESYKGVKWVCVGDSMTEVNSTANKRYYDYIAEELGFTTYNYGVGGTGYAARLSEDKAFYQRIPNITQDFDVITIFGSVNDIPLISGMGLGTYTDSTNATIAGCINLALDAIYTLKPFTKIGIIAPPPTAGNNPDGNLLGVAEQNYCDMLAQICKNRGIPYLDLYNCSALKPWDADFREEFYKENGVQDSGVHPNSKGQEMISTKIREFIKTII